eukprot:TRINITY_DN1481_c0_g1_i5.p1 TRINITY_DN1481_c0_g1~~TRINITY_DN1481_c0_g1_i5.p1  ORF type:complete len:163 (+),score=32.85 TRINITY_DN1481_c0_g1_i5:296-784(+)
MKTARKRLIEEKTGYVGEDSAKGIQAIVMDITRCLLSTKDMLELGMVSIEYLAPSIRDCFIAMQKYPTLPSSYDGLSILERWNLKLSGMKAADQLCEDDVKQIKYDLANIFDSFGMLVQSGQQRSLSSVSYTHLTLPTILLVQISVVAVSLKKKKILYMHTV